jgi:hypothetical protein
MRIRPAVPGAIVRDPETKRPLPPEGADVAETSYWLRRLRSRDVVLVEPAGYEPVTPITTREP